MRFSVVYWLRYRLKVTIPLHPGPRVGRITPTLSRFRPDRPWHGPSLVKRCADAANVTSTEFDLPGVGADADRDAEPGEFASQSQCEGHSTGRTVECRQAVAARVVGWPNLVAQSGR